MVTFSLTWQYINTSPSSSIRNHKRTHYLLFPLHIMGHSLGKPKLLTAKFKLMPRLFCHLSSEHQWRLLLNVFCWWNDSRGGDGDHYHYGWGSISQQSSSASFVYSPGLNSSNLGGSPTIELLVMRVSVWVGSSKITPRALQICRFLSFLWIWSYKCTFFHT